MSATNNVISRLYHIAPPETWEADLIDIPGEHGLVPHSIRFTELAVHRTNLVRDAIRTKLVIITVPPAFAQHEPERPSAQIRLKTRFMDVTIAECSDGAEHDPAAMKRNVGSFLRQGTHWDDLLFRHVEACRHELDVLLGDKQAPRARRKLLDLRGHAQALRDRMATRVDPLEREGTNLRSHWLMEEFFDKGAVPHFEESRRNARGTDLEEGADMAVELGRRIAEKHLAASKLAHAKLQILRGRGDQ